MKHITFILLIFLSTLTCFANTYYVKTTGNDTSNSGRSWGAAFATLQKALEVSQYGDQIWVAEGTYKPTAYPKGAIPFTPPLTDRDKSFHLVNGVKLYGGFAGYETSILQRISNHVTILSGDIGVENDKTDNCYHVVLSIKDDSTTLIDGFTVTKGEGYQFSYAPFITVEGESVSHGFGGGMQNIKSSPHINNVSFLANNARDGAGITNRTSSPKLTNVTISGNKGQLFGGGMYNEGCFSIITKGIISSNSSAWGGGVFNVASSPVFVDVIISGNNASDGGGMHNKSSSAPILFNVFFISNTSSYGGGLQNDNSSPQLTNVVFLKNSASNTGGGILSWFSSSPVLKNVVFWSNSASVGGGMANNGSASPLLINVTFAENTTKNPAGPSGAAIYNLNNSSTVIKNGIFWGNKRLYNGIVKEDDFLAFSNSVFSITHTLMQLSNTAANYPPALFPAIDSGHNLFAQNPLFVDAASGNLRLQDCSPAINACDTSDTVTHDLDGKIRPYPYGVAIADMGAYENQSIAGGGPATLNVTEPITNGTVVKVAGEITATNQVSGATALYQATKSVTLLPDFSAIGNGFTAFIGGCESAVSTEIKDSSQK